MQKSKSHARIYSGSALIRPTSTLINYNLLFSSVYKRFFQVQSVANKNGRVLAQISKIRTGPPLQCAWASIYSCRKWWRGLQNRVVVKNMEDPVYSRIPDPKWYSRSQIAISGSSLECWRYDGDFRTHPEAPGRHLGISGANRWRSWVIRISVPLS